MSVSASRRKRAGTEKIDEMERSDVGGRTVFSHEERYWGYLAAALALLAGEAVLALTWLRRAP